MHPRVRNAIICDLVRTEDTGKHILIGVYSGYIVFNVLPAMLSCSLYLEIIPNKQNAEMGLKLRIEISGVEKPIEVAGSLIVKEEDSLVVILNMSAVLVPKDGTIKISVRFDGGRWNEALTKRVDVRPSSLPTP